MIVVSDTSPITALITGGKIELLTTLFGEVKAGAYFAADLISDALKAVGE